ncbi:hypothetical protein T4E_4697 [Trichinella pseudospiralis]|uniref:Uncharacterized protein n=1 Tax=Trichinella pseudospiralis TaxID=6337 RepID=A0A0V0XVZ6_TRIPS|nr:hypothetical protein T4E_4697 [Trichinella pseudospiralis]
MNMQGQTCLEKQEETHFTSSSALVNDEQVKFTRSTHRRVGLFPMVNLKSESTRLVDTRLEPREPCVRVLERARAPKAHIAELRKCNKEQPQFFKVLYRDHVKEEQSFITIHNLFETFSPCKSIDSSSPDTTEVETEEQRSVSG